MPAKSLLCNGKNNSSFGEQEDLDDPDDYELFELCRCKKTAKYSHNLRHTCTNEHKNLHEVQSHQTKYRIKDKKGGDEKPLKICYAPQDPKFEKVVMPTCNCYCKCEYMSRSRDTQDQTLAVDSQQPSRKLMRTFSDRTLKRLSTAFLLFKFQNPFRNTFGLPSSKNRQYKSNHSVCGDNAIRNLSLLNRDTVINPSSTTNTTAKTTTMFESWGNRNKRTPFEGGLNHVNNYKQLNSKIPGDDTEESQQMPFQGRCSSCTDVRCLTTHQTTKRLLVPVSNKPKFSGNTQNSMRYPFEDGTVEETHKTLPHHHNNNNHNYNQKIACGGKRSSLILIPSGGHTEITSYLLPPMTSRSGYDIADDENRQPGAPKLSEDKCLLVNRFAKMATIAEFNNLPPTQQGGRQFFQEKRSSHATNSTNGRPYTHVKPDKDWLPESSLFTEITNTMPNWDHKNKIPDRAPADGGRQCKIDGGILIPKNFSTPILNKGKKPKQTPRSREPFVVADYELPDSFCKSVVEEFPDPNRPFGQLSQLKYSKSHHGKIRTDKRNSLDCTNLAAYNYGSEIFHKPCLDETSQTRLNDATSARKVSKFKARSSMDDELGLPFRQESTSDVWTANSNEVAYSGGDGYLNKLTQLVDRPTRNNKPRGDDGITKAPSLPRTTSFSIPKVTPLIPSITTSYNNSNNKNCNVGNKHDAPKMETLGLGNKKLLISFRRKSTRKKIEEKGSNSKEPARSNNDPIEPTLACSVDVKSKASSPSNVPPSRSDSGYCSWDNINPHSTLSSTSSTTSSSKEKVPSAINLLDKTLLPEKDRAQELQFYEPNNLASAILVGNRHKVPLKFCKDYHKPKPEEPLNLNAHQMIDGNINSKDCIALFIDEELKVGDIPAQTEKMLQVARFKARPEEDEEESITESEDGYCENDSVVNYYSLLKDVRLPPSKISSIHDVELIPTPTTDYKSDSLSSLKRKHQVYYYSLRQKTCEESLFERMVFDVYRCNNAEHHLSNTAITDCGLMHDINEGLLVDFYNCFGITCQKSSVNSKDNTTPPHKQEPPCVDNSHLEPELLEKLVLVTEKKLQALTKELEEIKVSLNREETSTWHNSLKSAILKIDNSHEANKIDQYLEDSDKIIALIVNLSVRIARNKQTTLQLNESATPGRIRKSKLESQYRDALLLKSSMEKKFSGIENFIRKFLTTTECDNFRHYCTFRSKLKIDQRYLVEKIKITEEHLRSLQSVMTEL